MKINLLIVGLFLVTGITAFAGEGNWVKDYLLTEIGVGLEYSVDEQFHPNQDVIQYNNYEGRVYLDYTRKSHSDLFVDHDWKLEIIYSYYDTQLDVHQGALGIAYEDGNFTYTDYESIELLAGASGFSVTVSAITASYNTGTGWVTETNIYESEHIPVEDITFRLELQSIEQYTLTLGAGSTDIAGIKFTPSSFRLGWNFVEGAEAYDIEWVFIDGLSREYVELQAIYGNAGLLAAGGYETPFLLKEPSRVRTWKTNHTIDKAFPNGMLCFRVRPVSRFVESGVLTDQVRPGDWSYFQLSNQYLDGNVSLSNIAHHEISSAAAFQMEKNWLYGVSYAENGKNVSSVTYYDGTNRARQSGTYNASDNVTLIGESKYDYEGRQTISVIPAPVSGRQMGYHSNFNLALGGDVFDEDNYDRGLVTTTTDPMATTSGAARYFSPANNFQNDPFRAAIPDAGGYPYSQTVYRNDGSGRIERVGGVGPDFQVSTDQAMRTYYGSPTWMELKRLFGTNVSDNPDGYRKELVRDANGQYSVTYYDKRGNVIATGLTGNAPDNLIELTDFEAEEINTPLNTNNIQTQHTLSSTHTFLNMVEGQNITLHYNLMNHVNQIYPEGMQIEGYEGDPLDPYCSSCIYDVKIQVLNQQGAHMGGSPYTFHFDPPGYEGEGYCVMSLSYLDELIQVHLPEIGEYTIIKELTVDVDGMLDNFDAYLEAQGVLDASTFISDYLENVDLSGCFESCEDYCAGKWMLDYKQGHPGTTNLDAQNAWAALTEGARQTYLESCVGTACNQEELAADLAGNGFVPEEGAAHSNLCDMYKERMIDQLMPGGAFFQSVLEGNGSIITVNGNPYPLNYFYQNPDQWTREIVAANLYLHREFCHYLRCDEWTESQGYSLVLASKMHQAGWNNTATLYNFPQNTDITINGTFYTQDPFITSTANQYMIANQLQHLATRVNNYLGYLYTQNNNQPLSCGLVTLPTAGPLKSYVEYMATCAQNAGMPMTAAELSQLKVNIFKGAYEQIKEDILREYKMATILSYPAGCMYYTDDHAIFPGALSKDELEIPTIDFFLDLEAGAPDCETLAWQNTQNWIDQLSLPCQEELGLVTELSGNYTDNYDQWSVMADYASDNNPAVGDGVDALFYAYAMNTCATNTWGWFYDPDPASMPAAVPGELQYDVIITTLSSTCGITQPLNFEVSTPGQVGTPVMDISAEALPPQACVDNLLTYINTGFSQINISSASCLNSNSSDSYEYPSGTVDNMFNGCNYFTYDSPVNGICHSNARLSFNDLCNGLTDLPGGTYSFSLHDCHAYAGEGDDTRCPVMIFLTPTLPENVSVQYLSNPVYIGVEIAGYGSWQGEYYKYEMTLHLSNGTTIEGSFFLRPHCSAYLQTEYEFSIDDFSGAVITVPDYQLDCIEMEMEQAAIDAQLAYDQYILDLRNDFLASIDCIHKQKEDFSMRYHLKEYQYTLYYYDLAGNLVQTVPPQGVELLTESEVLSGLNPPHHLETRYEYNGLNTLIAQYTPDGGHSDFHLDRLYRVRYSQTAQQQVDAKAAYTRYDELGRVIEAGEIKLPSSLNQFSYLASSTEVDVPSGAKKLDYTLTYYEEGYTPDPAIGLSFSGGVQQNLRNAIGAVYHRQGEYTASGNLQAGSAIETVIAYSYDAHKNVKELRTVNYHLEPMGLHLRKLTYEYDLVSGNVNEVIYQQGERDEYRHRYHYDANNRLIRTFTSRDGVLWDMDVKYFYYLHGSLARTELGQDKVQGTDYAYNLNGWLKGVNSMTLDRSRDLGADGSSNRHRYFGMDAHGYYLGYYANDYSPIGTVTAFADMSSLMAVNLNDEPGGQSGFNMSSLYNGNISHMVTAMRNTDEEVIDVLANNYRYDQLQRIKAMDVYSDEDLISTNTFTNPGLYRGGAYQTRYSFDGNGNLQSLKRNGSGLADDGVGTTALLMDDFQYFYYEAPESTNQVAESWNTNQLGFVTDAATGSGGNYGNDIESQASANYVYNKSGQLVSDEQEEIEAIEWTVTGKVKSIRFSSESDRNDLKFVYDPMDMRVAKMEYLNDLHTHVKYTYYSYDAQGNVLAIYDREQKYTSTVDGEHRYSDEVFLSEQVIYGSSRVGIRKFDERLVVGNITQVTGSPKNIDYIKNCTWSVLPLPAIYDQTEREVGRKYYELSNHLGNVLNVVTDRKIGQTEMAEITDQVGISVTAEGTITRTVTGNGWNQAGGASVQAVNDGQSIVWTLGGSGAVNNRQIMLGLSYSNADEDYSTIDYCWHTSSQGLRIYNSGNIVFPYGHAHTTNELYYAPGDELRLTREFGKINFYYNNILKYSWVDATPSIPMYADFSIHTSGAKIYGLKIVNGYAPDVVSYSDYYPYGMLLDGRHGSEEDYRYGFNGMESDDEVKGNGNSYTTEFRQYDPRIGRWLTLDPLMAKYPWQSPYAAFNNNPIYFVDPFGLEGTNPGEPEKGYTCYDESHDEVITYTGDGSWQNTNDYISGIENQISSNGAKISEMEHMVGYINNRISSNQSAIATNNGLTQQSNELRSQLSSLEGSLNKLRLHQQGLEDELNEFLIISEILLSGGEILGTNNYDDVSRFLDISGKTAGYLSISQGAIENLGGIDVVAKLIREKQFTTVWNGQTKTWSINFMGNKSVSAEFVATAKSVSAQGKALSIVKAGGVILSVGGAFISTMQYANGDIGEVEFGADLVFTGIAIWGGPAGWVASGLYFMGKEALKGPKTFDSNVGGYDGSYQQIQRHPFFVPRN